MAVKRLRPGMKESQIRAWAKLRGLESWLEIPAAEMESHSWGGASFWLRRHGGSRSVLDVLSTTPSTTRHGSAKRPPRVLQRSLIATLQEAATLIDEGLKEERQRRRQPLDGALGEAQERLLALRETLRGEGVYPYPSNTGRMRVLIHEDPPSVHYQVYGHVRCTGAPVVQPRLEVQLQEPDGRRQLRCSCPSGRSGRCPIGLAVLDATLDLLESPTGAAVLQPALELQPWERALGKLSVALEAPKDPEGRLLAWKIRAPEGRPIELQPALVRPLKTKAGMRFWRTGLRPIIRGEVPGVRPADRRAAAWLEDLEQDWRYSERRERPAVFEALALLVDHPRIYLDGKPPRPLRLTRGALRLRWEAAPGGGLIARVTLDGQPIDAEALEAMPGCGDRRLHIDAEAGRCTLIEVHANAPGLIEALTRGSPFPPEAADVLMGRLDAIGAVLPIELDEALRGEAVAPDDWPIMQLRQLDGAVRAAVRIEPLPGATLQVPGQGERTFYGLDGDRRVHTTRDLETEREQIDADLAELGQPQVPPDGPYQWTLDDPEDVLALLEALERHDDLFTLAWEGPPLSVTRGATASDLRVTVGMQQDWFGIGGSLEVDGVSVPLLELFAAARAGRRVIAVGDGTWVRLTEALREQLAAASGAVFERKDGRMEVSALNAPGIAALEEQGATLEAPPQWTSAVARMREAATLELPEQPEGLRATLRPYQVEGWTWLARLLHWAPGGVLADDMGLGKTVQALALLLHRRQRGPALVVGPTSVGFNWLREAERFTPELRARLYRGPDRATLLAELQPGDVLITSYELMTRDREALEGQRFGTVIFDEAQALKNPATKRAKTARALDTEAAIGLTGTPVENRTGELWSLFGVLAPGLLGSWERFRGRFAAPIERDDSAEARETLARLIRPFLLRRTKAEVAPELPPRTELREDIEPSRQERALYERARLAALAQLTGGEELPEQQRRFQVLAAITRLRQLACHPRLVDPKSKVPSAKLARLLELVEGLRAEGHRALIFSQFTKHLAIVREALEAAGVSLRYLDGSTPAEKRRAEVDAFQAGEGEVFLISLKAGGTGLNLTGATYVIHLDPWWNPAVEDQATDRAHRIGQTEAVTVYRLVTLGTIEESILELHKQKRALVEGLLAGTGRAAALSTEELLALLAER